jgi:hypothetical protein
MTLNFFERAKMHSLDETLDWGLQVHSQIPTPLGQL